MTRSATRQILSATARALVPEQLWVPLASIRARRHSHRLNESWGVRTLSERLLRQLGPTVRSGPFAGLILPEAAAAEHLGPYLIGTYEHELHGVWRRVAESRVSEIVDVGAKFGYYAVGLARLLKAPAVAFDPDPWARRLTRQTALLNGAQVTLRSRCTRSWLERLTPGALLLVDCDGCEVALLASPSPASLARCTVVVEVHEDVVPGSGCRLRETLDKTHDVVSIPSDAAPPATDVKLTDFSDQDRTLATRELRPTQSWLVGWPRDESHLI
jgi:hypothetical protein